MTWWINLSCLWAAVQRFMRMISESRPGPVFPNPHFPIIDGEVNMQNAKYFSEKLRIFFPGLDEGAGLDSSGGSTAEEEAAYDSLEDVRIEKCRNPGLGRRKLPVPPVPSSLSLLHSTLTWAPATTATLPGTRCQNGNHFYVSLYREENQIWHTETFSPWLMIEARI